MSERSSPRVLLVQGKNVLVDSGPLSCLDCEHVGGRHSARCVLFGSQQKTGANNQGPQRVLDCYRAEALAKTTVVQLRDARIALLESVVEAADDCIHVAEVVHGYPDRYAVYKEARAKVEVGK